jgi:hypothetical protein
MSSGTVTLQIIGGPSLDVPWFAGMNARQVLEEAWNNQQPAGQLTYGLQYFGAQLGYGVFMLNETFETFLTTEAPYLYWEFLVNGTPASKGIEQTIVNSGDIVTFELQLYDPSKQSSTTVGAKHARRMSAQGKN